MRLPRGHALALLMTLAPSTAWSDTPIDLRQEIAKAIAEARAESKSDPHGGPSIHVSPDPGPAALAPSPGPQRAPKGVRPRPRPPKDDAASREPEAVWTTLMQGNLRFVEGRPRTRETVQLRRDLARGQKPRAVVLACSDSRVPPELLFDQALGELFVVRTSGNTADPLALGSIEYAVGQLGARLLVVLGHEECSAVDAAASGAPMASPNLEAMVRPIRSAIADFKTCGASPPARRLRVEANVHQSHHDVLAHSAVLRSAFEDGQLAVLSAVYGLESGVVTWLEDPADVGTSAPPPPAPAKSSARAATKTEKPAKVEKPAKAEKPAAHDHAAPAAPASAPAPAAKPAAHPAPAAAPAHAAPAHGHGH